MSGSNGRGLANGGPLVGELEKTAQRWPAASAARLDRFVRRAVADAAGVQSRRVLAAAEAELCNRALLRLFELCYEETDGGLLCNLGPGGLVLLPTPWSRTRHRDYGLTDHGGRVLRACLVHQLERMASFRRPLRYERGRWWLNLAQYPALPAASAWLEHWGITPDLWLRANDEVARLRSGGAA